MPVQGHRYTLLSAATAVDADRFVVSTDMIVGAYTVANDGLPPTGTGARRVTITHTSVGTEDTLGTITVVGTDPDGAAISEEMTPEADDVATSTNIFASVTSVTGAGWVIDAVEGTEDTITVGMAAGGFIADGDGVLHMVIVNTTAAGAVTLTDSAGTIAVLKSSITEGHYEYNVAFDGFLGVALAAASNVTVIYSQ